MADIGDTLPAADSTGTPLVAAGKGNVEAQADMCTHEEADSRCSREAVGRGNVEPAAAHSILVGEVGRRIFEVAAGRSILGAADNKGLVFHLVDSGT